MRVRALCLCGGLQISMGPSYTSFIALFLYSGCFRSLGEWYFCTLFSNIFWLLPDDRNTFAFFYADILTLLNALASSDSIRFLCLQFCFLCVTVCMPLFCFLPIVLGRTSVIVLKRSAECGHPAVFTVMGQLLEAREFVLFPVGHSLAHSEMN